jgi:hypothetical protein
VQFTVHSDLGRVVQAIIREFERRPPHLVGETAARLPPARQKGKSFQHFNTCLTVTLQFCSFCYFKAGNLIPVGSCKNSSLCFMATRILGTDIQGELILGTQGVLEKLEKRVRN